MIAPDGSGGKRLRARQMAGIGARQRRRRAAAAHGCGTTATFATPGITASLGES